MELSTKFSTSDLYDFQLEAFDKIKSKRAAYIVFEPGTGKTYMAIARDLYIRQKFFVGGTKTLVIGPPNSMIITWITHYLKLTNLNAKVINIYNKELFLPELGDIDVVITHWDSLYRIPELKKIKWGHIVGDELHKIKNRKSKRTIAFKQLKTQFRTGLTGTPIYNKPPDLWSQLNWIDRYNYFFKSYHRFFEEFMQYDNVVNKKTFRLTKKFTGVKNKKLLHLVLADYTVYAKKSDVLNLPPKQYGEIRLPMLSSQLRAYQEMEEDMITMLENNEIVTAPVKIAQYQRLQQFAIAYMGGDKMIMPSNKITNIIKFIKKYERPLVIFSCYKKAINLLSEQLSEQKIHHVAITGDVHTDLRDIAVLNFQLGNVRIFLATVGVCSESISLTAANVAIFIDRHWTTAVNTQAEDRIHRIGQRRQVKILDIRSISSIDDKKAAILDKKKQWIREALGVKT